MTRSGIGVFVAAMAVGAARAEAQQSEVKLTTDRPVYKLGSGMVTLTLTNGGTGTIGTNSPNPWVIYRGDQIVFAPISILIVGSLTPGQSKSWGWDMKDMGGLPVTAGSYTVKVGPLWSGYTGNSGFSLSKTIALTPSGKIAGSSRFPLKVGNEWNYGAVTSSGGLNQSMKVTTKSENWYKVTNLVGMNRWARLTSSSKPTLFVSSQPSDPSARLFRFNQPVGYTYTTNMETFTQLKVGAIDETVETPAGMFLGCYRLDVAASTIADGGYGSFWFAPGVGLVQYSKPWIGGTNFYRLVSVTIQGSDGKVYTLSHQ